MNGKPSRMKLSAKTIIVITAVILAAVVITVLLYMIFAGGLLDKLFGDNENYAEGESSVFIPEMTVGEENDEQDFYYERNTEDPLADVKELDSYIRTVRMLTSYGEERNIESVTVTKKGEKYKAESDSRIMIYDGETLYINYGFEILKIPTEDSTYYEEIGVTSLETVRSMVGDTEHYKTVFEVSADNRIIKVSLSDLVNEGLTMRFEISAESGFVISERFYLNDEAYKTVLTESFDILPDNDISDETFLIPE